MSERVYRSLVRSALLRSAAEASLLEVDEQPHRLTSGFIPSGVEEDIRRLADSFPLNLEEERNILRLQQLLEPLLFTCVSDLRNIDPHPLLQQLMIIEKTKAAFTLVD